MWRGTLAGLSFFAAAVCGLYFTPLRLPTLALAGGEYPAHKAALLAQYGELQERERRIAAAPETVPDSLKAAQELAWKEYGAQRDRLEAWVRTQSSPSLQGLRLWVSDLWIWLAFLLGALVAGGALAGRQWSQPAPAKRPPPVVRRPEPDTVQMEDALRRISALAAADEATRGRTQVQASVPAPSPIPEEPETPEPPPSFQPLAAPAQDERPPAVAAQSLNLFQEEEEEPAAPGGSDTQFLEIDSPYSPRVRAEAAPDPTPGPEVWSPHALTMEDAPSGTSETGDGEEPPWGRLPETTEFEHLERQREEVLRCARKGMTSSEIARRLRISQEQVDLIIRLRRERG